MIHNIIFDWSGTLVDDLPAVWKATNHVMARAEKAELSLEQFRAEFFLPFTLFYERHLPHVPLAQLEEWFHGHFREVQDSVRELPHAREFLEFCRARKLRTFLLSTIHRDHFTAQAAVTGFDRYLDGIYIEVRDKRARIHQILEQHGLKPAETVFVGDMQHDIETARHGGIHSCAVLTGYNTLAQLRAANPDLVVEHLGELQELLERTGMELSKNSGQGLLELRPVVTVGALVSDAAGKVLMVRTHKWSDLWGIPGGKVKWGEPAEEALRREILEETGLKITNIDFVLVQDCIHSKEFYRDAHFVLLNYTCSCEGETEVTLNDEAREFRWTTVDAALELPLNQPTRKLLTVISSRSREEESMRAGPLRPG